MLKASENINIILTPAMAAWLRLYLAQQAEKSDAAKHIRDRVLNGIARWEQREGTRKRKAHKYGVTEDEGRQDMLGLR